MHEVEWRSGPDEGEQHWLDFARDLVVGERVCGG